MRLKFETKLRQIKKARTLLEHAMVEQANGRITELLVLIHELNLDVSTLIEKAIMADDPKNDLVLIYCDGIPEGTVVPMHWLPMIQKYEPGYMTVVRVSHELGEEVHNATKKTA